MTASVIPRPLHLAPMCASVECDECGQITGSDLRLPDSALVVMLAHVLPDAVDDLPALVPGVAVGVGVAVLVADAGELSGARAGHVPARPNAPVGAVHLLPLLRLVSWNELQFLSPV